jgi:predicted transcriptional regulator
MARPASPTLTDGELRLMNVLWERGPCSVLAIQERLEEPLADSTIRTLLGVLADKGYVRRTKDGRAHIYHANVQRGEARETMVQQVVKRFFRSPADLVLNLLDAGELDAAELAHIRRALDRRGRKT